VGVDNEWQVAGWRIIIFLPALLILPDGRHGLMMMCHVPLKTTNFVFVRVEMPRRSDTSWRLSTTRTKGMITNR
jgi:hypothetical protein